MGKHILIIADGRSAITKRWIDVLLSLNHRVTLVSTYPFTENLDVENTFVLPIAFSSAGSEKSNRANSRSIKRLLIQQLRPFIMKVRYNLGPYTIPSYQDKLRKIIADIKPDLVHALRVPFEGMLASSVPREIPLLISIWGNDFTLHAPASKKMRELTHQAMHRADGVLADVQRDITLAHQWGLDEKKATLVVPGGGGILLDEIQASKAWDGSKIDIPSNVPVIVNPRGIRAYARTDVFFQSIPKVLEVFPEAIFLCPAMERKTEAVQWVERLGIGEHVRLLENLPQKDLWSIFHRSQISVSITTHDGTPNTLLEAMACGCFPIAGDIESLREWITPGINGFLVPNDSPQQLAEAIIEAINNPNLQKTSSKINYQIIQSRAEVGLVRQKLEEFYNQF